MSEDKARPIAAKPTNVGNHIQYTWETLSIKIEFWTAFKAGVAFGIGLLISVVTPIVAWCLTAGC